MGADKLNQKLEAAFSGTARPAPEAIVSHSCEECFRIRDDFAPHAWPTVPARVIEYHRNSFPLFTPQAFRYYLPAYVIYALHHPESEVAGLTIERLRDLGQPDVFWTERLAVLSEVEREG